ncbi:DUF1338 domain-containing protein [Reinekea marinisedimentorum]|uniref:2-oxoadipate dioxygenase/decarboxylase n=1 Tax=Reinekea marinisedimentorum TaxID=230495 RepID=A0A4R3I588_9GAMM|nr:DUF1338 domain-containing protein [Reinekea marinisedimentorum]TCS40103.1 uncharacterized protein DUF1338 [Reinekea marinisedimentorum]
MNTEQFFSALWQDYTEIAPQAPVIAQALQSRGEQLINDHVAFRTFNHSPINIERLEPIILSLGYKRFQPYHFEQKHLDAMGYVPADDRQPKIFLSELRTEELSPQSQHIIESLVRQIPATMKIELSLMWRGILWQPPSLEDYQRLAQESEYAAWMSVMGLRANHFTIFINALKTLTEVEQVNQFIESLGFSINASGGRIKGSPQVFLEQSSTLASTQNYRFGCGNTAEIPTCYYEFARRYKTTDGSLYQGFVAASADKIFESTNSKPHAEQ